MIRHFPVLLVLAVGGCNRVIANIDFERMIDQAKYEAYESDHEAPERGVMRHPPQGTVPRDRSIHPGLHARAWPGGEYRDRVPLTVDRALLERGRDRYERFCAACHGITGFGNQPVIENMALRPAPSLHQPRFMTQAPGRLFSTISHGYGLMPSYSAELEPRDRWAVVAYLEALWLSQRVELARLPAPLRAQARKELP